jgi:outer membrane protein TolC
MTARRRSSLALATLFASSAALAQEAGAPSQSAQQPQAALQPQVERLAPADVLAFDAAVKLATRRNPTVQVAMEEIARARALVEETRAAALPQFSANVVYTRVERDRTENSAAGPVIVVPANQVNANLTLALPLVQPRTWVQWAHAKENVDVTRANAEDVRRQLAFTTARTYLSILAQHRVVEVSNRALVTAKAHFDFAHQRFAGGYGTRVDEVRAQQEVASDEAQLQANLAQLARLRETLGVLVGVDRPIDCTEDVELPVPPPVDEGIKAATEERSDVLLARRRLVAAQHVERDDWADFAPTLAGSFQPFFQYPPTLSLPEWGYQGVLALSWTIYDGGLRYGLEKERKSLRLEAATQLEGTVRQAKSDVRAADEEIRHAKAALQSAVEAARLAAEAVRLTNLGYRAGATTNIEVIDAERVARDADTSVAGAEDSWRQALLDMLIASGRFPPPG